MDLLKWPEVSLLTPAKALIQQNSTEAFQCYLRRLLKMTRPSQSLLESLPILRPREVQLLNFPLIWPKCQQKNWLSSMHAWAGWQNHFHWCCQLIQARVRTKALRTWQGIFWGAAAKAGELTRGFWLVAESTASSLESKPQQQKWISCSFCNWQITKLYNTDCNQLPILSRHQP